MHSLYTTNAQPQTKRFPSGWRDSPSRQWEAGEAPGEEDEEEAEEAAHDSEPQITVVTPETVAHPKAEAEEVVVEESPEVLAAAVAAAGAEMRETVLVAWATVVGILYNNLI